MRFFESTAEKIEDTVGLSIDEIRQMGPDELRFHLESKNKKEFTYHSEFPAIGRGNVLRDNLMTTKQINKEIDNIIGMSM